MFESRAELVGGSLAGAGSTAKPAAQGQGTQWTVSGQEPGSSMGELRARQLHGRAQSPAAVAKIDLSSFRTDQVLRVLDQGGLIRNRKPVLSLLQQSKKRPLSH